MSDSCLFNILVTDSPIQGSVGKDALNRPDDVRTIQQLLNAVPPTEGGPDAPLIESGSMDSATQAAIVDYQRFSLGWPEPRFEPRSHGIDVLVQRIVQSPNIPAGALDRRLGVRDEVGVKILSLALAVPPKVAVPLQLLKSRLTRSSPDIMALLNKHFANGNDTVDMQDVGGIMDILTDMLVYMSRRNAFGKAPFENLFVYDRDYSGSNPAFCFAGRNKEATTESTSIAFDPETKRVYKAPGQSIYFTPVASSIGMVEMHLVVLHEMTHFVGGRAGQEDQIKDIAYHKDPKFLTLTKKERLHNADSLGVFLIEWCLGTQMLFAIPNMPRRFMDFPQVHAGNNIVMQPPKPAAP